MKRTGNHLFEHKQIKIRNMFAIIDGKKYNADDFSIRHDEILETDIDVTMVITITIKGLKELP